MIQIFITGGTFDKSYNHISGDLFFEKTHIPEMLKRNYDKRMITGVVQAGSSLGILIPPSVVMVLYGMIARQPVSKLWMAGILPGLLMALLFLIYIYVRCKLQPELGPPLKKEERNISRLEKIRLLKAGIIPFLIFKLVPNSKLF